MAVGPDQRHAVLTVDFHVDRFRGSVLTFHGPPDPPTVTSSRNSPGDGYAGRILVLRGGDGAGKPYETEALVFRENRRSLKAVNSVYWSGATIVENEQDTPLGTAPAVG